MTDPVIPYGAPIPKGSKWITLANGQKILVKKGTKFRKAKRTDLPQGHGSRLHLRYWKYVAPHAELVRIKRMQERAERRAGVRVGNGLFDNPLSPNPRIIGVVKPERKRQQHPKSGKRVYVRKKDRIKMMQAGGSRASRLVFAHRYR